MTYHIVYALRICWGFWCRLGLCRFEGDLDAKLMQVGVDLLKVAGGFIGEHEDKHQEARMTGGMFSRGCYNAVVLIPKKTATPANGGAACSLSRCCIIHSHDIVEY